MTSTLPNKFHPGEFLKDELEARGWTVDDFARKANLGHVFVVNFLAGRRNVTPAIAESLSTALGTSAQFWHNLQRSFDESVS